MKTIIIVSTILATIVVFLVLRARKDKSHNQKAAFSEAEYNRYNKAKETALARILGPRHNLVGHAIIPFQVGGNVDMYYFPNGISGTGFATMELIEPDGSGPKPNRIGTYELVAFTKHKIPADEGKEDENQPFNKIERRLNGLLTSIGFYSREAVLNPGDTSEVPAQDGEPNRCIILDDYDPNGVGLIIDGKKHSLLLVMEVFCDEMEFAMKYGTAALLKKLKDAGYYPYSDLDRKSVL